LFSEERDCVSSMTLPVKPHLQIHSHHFTLPKSGYKTSLSYIYSNIRKWLSW
jgi:hypothetical protein